MVIGQAISDKKSGEVSDLGEFFNLGLFPEMGRQGTSFSIGVPQSQEIKVIGHVHYCLKQNLAKNEPEDALQ